MSLELLARIRGWWIARSIARRQARYLEGYNWARFEIDSGTHPAVIASTVGAGLGFEPSHFDRGALDACLGRGPHP